MEFTKYEIIIIKTLYGYGSPLTTSEVAKYAKISRPTATKYLNSLFEQGYLRQKRSNYCILWRIK